MLTANHPHTSTADVSPGWRQYMLSLVLRTVIKHRLRGLSATPEGIQQLRSDVEGLAKRFMHTADSTITIAADSIGGIDVERLQPADRQHQVVLYIHGGAFIACSPFTHRGITLPLARYTGCEVIAVNYRLAPEHPYPAAVNDVLDVYRSLLASSTAHEVTVAGDSAGGNLVLALLHAAKEEGLAMPASAVCLSPITDLSGGSASIRTNITSDALLPGERMHELTNIYLHGAYVREPTASPLFGDFAGFPPLLFHVGDTEILFDDSRRTVARARAFGTEAHLRIWPGLPHVFHAFSEYLPVAHVALKEIADFMLMQFRRPQ